MISGYVFEKHLEAAYIPRSCWSVVVAHYWESRKPYPYKVNMERLAADVRSQAHSKKRRRVMIGPKKWKELADAVEKYEAKLKEWGIPIAIWDDLRDED